MDNNLDELMYSLSLNRAYDEYSRKFKESTDQLLQNMQIQLKESFLSGYSEGHQNGFDEGIMETKLKMLVKLAVHTDLDDQIIYALKQVRKKQKEQI